MIILNQPFDIQTLSDTDRKYIVNNIFSSILKKQNERGAMLRQKG